ncbi:hypothetical protein ACFPJ1_27025 [Kribbella qitaiheensis]|uniref:hypothetical protein n=1 Tax=Kribbella qitaiheensis TaxID=1544730 RepID=UPI0036181408
MCRDPPASFVVSATAAARRMIAQGQGVILMLSASSARESGFEMGGFSLACASIECLTRTLAGAIGRYGGRVVALRPNFTPETHPEWVNLEDDSLKSVAANNLLELPQTIVHGVFRVNMVMAELWTGSRTGSFDLPMNAGSA